MIYKFDESIYKFAKENPDKIAWDDFRRGSNDFPDYAQIANPHLVKGSTDYWFWRKFFNEYFKTSRCQFNFMLRLINSFMITGEKPIATNE